MTLLKCVSAVANVLIDDVAEKCRVAEEFERWSVEGKEATGERGNGDAEMIEDRLGDTGVSGSGTDSGSTVGLIGVTGALTVTSVTSRSWTVFRRLWRLVVDRIEVDLINSGS